jgi:hypothetical protein
MGAMLTMQFAKFSFKNAARKCFAFLMALIIVLTSTAFMPQGLKKAYAGQFNMGTENSWAEPYMKKLYDDGIMTGDSNGNMNPNKDITRAEFVSMINRAFGYENSSSAKTNFNDIKGNEWYAKDIAIAYNKGYFSGDGKNASNATGNLTREQAVSLLCRNIKIDEVEGDNTVFADGKNISNWSLGCVNAAAKKGYISGYKDNTFRPHNNITRGEAAKMFSDAIGKLINKTGVQTLGYQDGNVTITASGVTLENTVINGDLYITPGVGLGHTYFNNVHVTGDVIVSGSGESYAGKSSVDFKDSTLANLIIKDSNSDNIKSVKLAGNSTVYTTEVSTNTYLEELSNRSGGFKNVVLNGDDGTELHLSGVFDQISVKGEKNKLYLDDGTIKELIVDEEGKDSNVNIDDDSNVDKLLLDVGTKVTGDGEISYVKANAAGTTVSTLPDDVEIRPGLTANIDGKDMSSEDAEKITLNPRILSGYPDITDIGQSDAKVLFETNKPGRVYWVVTSYENKNVSSDDIIKPGKYDSEIIDSGDLYVDSTKEYSETISGLDSDTEYVVSAVFIDEKDDESSKKRETFTTINTSKPSFLTGYPTVSDIENTSAEVKYVTTKDVTLYWAIFPKNSTAPDIKAFKDQNFFGEIKSGEKDVDKYEEGTINITGLEEMESYDIYLFMTDGAKDSSITKLNLTTVDKTAPQFNTGYPKIEDEDKTSAQISLSVDEDGKVYFSLYDGGTTFPVPNQDGTSPSMDSEEAKQQVILGKGGEKTYSANVKADATATAKLTGLDSTKDYDLYFVAEDGSGNLSGIKELKIGAKPDFLSGYPKIVTIKNTSAQIAIDVTKDCKAYWAILPSGSVAPSVINLKSQSIAGATNNGVIEDCKKNVENMLNIDNLKEYSDYDIYMMVSDGTTDSEIQNLTLKTSDLTPPEFSNGYPMIGTVTDTTIAVKVRVNEGGNIYYVLCKKGDEFPVPATLGGDKPSLDSDEAKNQVVSGNNGYKSGKINIKQNTEASLTISGLAAETPYDLYLVAVDGFNNISNVKYMEVKTLDNTAPTAELDFADTISGDVVAGSEIKIKFSEEVIDNESKKRLSEVSTDILAKDIILYDMSTVRTTAFNIDFSKATVADVDGKTIVTFPKGMLELKSGNAYQFELNDIADTSNNRMDDKTLLPEFNTVAPMVEINETIASTGMDMTFELTPQISETNDNILYDMIFTSNEKVEFEVYEKPKGQSSFTEVTGTSANPGKIIVEKDKSISLQNIKDKILSDKAEYDFDKFKDLTQTEYGIKIISIDGDTNRKGWNDTVQFNVKCIIGSYSGLSPVADNPTDRLSDAISEGKATVVNYPKDFSVKVYFTDTIIPEFVSGYPEIDNDNDSSNGLSQVGDTLIRPIVKTTKSATFYYLIAKTGTVTNPTADGIMDNKYKPQDGTYGSFSVTSGQTEFEFKIGGLNPEVSYTMYCFLKGTPAATSAMQVIQFTTVQVAAPKFETAIVRDRLEDSAIIELTLDKEATVDWIAFNRESMPDPTAVDGDLIRQKKQNEAYKPTDFGSASATFSKGESSAKATITIQNLEQDVYYDFYAVAKSDSGGGDSTILRIQNITPADKTKPTVLVTTVITNYGSADEGKPYSGEVTLTFSEPLYYIVKEGDPLLPLSKDAFKEGLDYGDFSLDIFSCKTADTDTETRALKSITLKFSGVYNNSTINYINLISDNSTNVAGSLHMTFDDAELEGKNRADSHWDYEFINK